MKLGMQGLRVMDMSSPLVITMLLRILLVAIQRPVVPSYDGCNYNFRLT